MKISVTDRGVHDLGAMLVAGGYETRLVGGAVRDIIVGLAPKDLDLATNALPEAVIELASRNGYRVIPTGLQHGTVTVVYENVGYEITTLRKDVETDGRHAVVEYVTDFSEDAARRDFTINAMSASLDGEVHDYFGGLKDLTEGRVRFVGDARQRIEEDYLRILRFFRFRARFGGKEDEGDLLEIARCADGLSNITVERVWSEISKILMHPNGVDQLALMSDLRVADLIGLPVDDDRLLVAGRVQRLSGRPATALGSLLGDVATAEQLASRWKLSNLEARDATIAAKVVSEQVDDPRYWLAQAIDGLDPSAAAPVLAAVGCLASAEALSGEIPQFPLKGRDLVGLVEKGPAMGQALRDAKQRWVDSDFTLSKEDLIHEICEPANGATIGGF